MSTFVEQPNIPANACRYLISEAKNVIKIMGREMPKIERCS
jgi:hypothetical protein